MSPSQKSQGMFASAWVCSHLHSHESVIFSYFWDSYFLSYGEFVEFIMKLRVQALLAALASGARGALPLVGGVS